MIALDTQGISLPEKFTYPFCYDPHPLAIKAAQILQNYLAEIHFPQDKGRMFGVLVVQGKEIGFLSAYSGSLPSGTFTDMFVPQVFQLQANTIPSTKEESRKLQDYIFSQYEMLNSQGESRNLLQIFLGTPLGYPPSGSGDCCAPKLLQYAFQHHLHPICMAEFWWGQSPKDEIRHHLTYYPACQGRCKPILEWMLKGMDVDLDPMETYNVNLEKQLRVVYEDQWIIVVDKPSGMLSAPGKISTPCVADILSRILHTHNVEYVPVHRLDMATSGLQILVKLRKSEGQPTGDMEIFKQLQSMFASRRVRKQYLALLDGCVSHDTGTISLPLSSDYLNRPAQRVDYEKGKTAITDYHVISRGRFTLVSLSPHTGRTHQLRVHCAAAEGLGCPIVGDRLYGRNTYPTTAVVQVPEQNLLVNLPIVSGSPLPLQLRAIQLQFEHPITQKLLSLSLDK